MPEKAMLGKAMPGKAIELGVRGFRSESSVTIDLFSALFGPQCLLL